jgi:hypothetical protein
MGTELDLDVIVNTITSVMVEAKSRSVPVVRSTRFALPLTFHIKSIIRLKILSVTVRNILETLVTRER